MKTTIITIAILLAIATGITAAVYFYKPPTTSDLVVLRDVTERQLATPDAAEILALCDLSGNKKWNGARLTFSDVTDVSYNEARRVSIEGANQWLSNEPERDKEIRDFTNQLNGVITALAGDTIGRPHSSIYLPIARQLALLSASKAARRILIVYSDLMENDPGMSFYDPSWSLRLQSDPDSVKKVLDRWQALPPLTGIDVYLVFRPKNATEDGQYRIASGFYQHLLEAQGARVHIGANLLN